jgi:tRNA(His) 5'-end guanylyltransferase
MNEIGDRMKTLENEYEFRIPPYNSFIIRLDGKNFSKFTKGLKKPFDNNFVKAMVLTMNNLVEKFNVTTGYTHSDEITLIFNKVCTKKEFLNKENKSTHSSNGRTIKLLTIMAGYCSVRFNYHLNELINAKNYTEKFVDKVGKFEQCFDARLLNTKENEIEIINHMKWRSTYDCIRNCISTYARSYFSAKQLNGIKTKEMITMMLDEKEFDWVKECPMYLKHGVYSKKELYNKEVEIDGKKETCVRSRITNKCFNINDNMLNVLLEKYWPDFSNFISFTL